MQQRHAEMFEDLRKAEQIHTHRRRWNSWRTPSYPENHSTRLLIEPLGVSRTHSVIEGDISTLRGYLSSGSSGA
jgi:hypothetical protein